MKVHPRLSYYNDVQDGTTLVTNTLETTNHLTPLHIPPGPPILPDRDTVNLKYKVPPRVPGARLVESRFHPFHPYVHTSQSENVHTAEFSKSTFKIPELNISARAANMLENVKKALWLSTYKRDFTGTGSMNPLLLDDHDVKTIGRATGELGINVDLRETFPSHTSQVRPLEGRIARLLQNRRPLLSGQQQQESSVVHMPPLQHTPDPVLRGFSEGVLSCGEVLPFPVQQCPNAENGTKRRNENWAQKREPWDRFRKITDTWKTESLYLRQLAVPPDPDPDRKPIESIYYEDLKPSRLDKYIVWHHPVMLSKPASADLNYRKHGNLQDLESTSSVEDTRPRDPLPEWIPNCGVARPQTCLLSIQDFYTKTDTIKRFNDLTRGGIRDLRDHDRKGRRHKFCDFHAFFFH
ncbi:uncharacterized protein C7orf31 homolog [Sphaerodactylus townsendi]|uniref:uncharacterized protein C7orf31 homolog n=1 Tax=Sphaerodactylus townsendi TaxID=933632 RepID=UPI002026CC6F|nr:uncharacterized protein C7orf31 homolog [Sphaerodactylus townsendi]